MRKAVSNGCKLPFTAPEKEDDEKKEKKNTQGASCCWREYSPDAPGGVTLKKKNREQHRKLFFSFSPADNLFLFFSWWSLSEVKTARCRAARPQGSDTRPRAARRTNKKLWVVAASLKWQWMWWEGLPCLKTFYELFTRRMWEIHPDDWGNAPSSVCQG